MAFNCARNNVLFSPSHYSSSNESKETVAQHVKNQLTRISELKGSFSSAWDSTTIS
jgi:hypothetical protein